MLVIPAIDLKDGQAVRLFKGDYAQKTVYSDKPEEIAKHFENIGADYLHVVDLDGAKVGQRVNLAAIQKIREAVSLPIELGGGIRNAETVAFYLDELKINRVILGTAAIQQPEFLTEMLSRYGAEKIVVGVDVKDGFVSTGGWLETSQVEYKQFIKYLESIGVKYIVATDISKDGTLTGPNFSMYQEIKAISNLNVVVSGGIKDNQNIYDVAKLGYYGCIVGKAFYDGKVDLAEVIACLRKG